MQSFVKAVSALIDCGNSHLPFLFKSTCSSF